MGGSKEVTLDFLKFVTSGRFLEIVTLGGFRKARISERDAIRFSEVCHRQGDSGDRDIRWFSQRKDFEGGCH